VKNNKQIGESIKKTEHRKPKQMRAELENQGQNEKMLSDEAQAWDKQCKLMLEQMQALEREEAELSSMLE
jgi:hypothetical protein